jgi:DNA-binding NtrC family response regulator
LETTSSSISSPATRSTWVRWKILIEDPVRPGRGCRPRRAQTVIVFTDVDLLSPHVQRRLARRLDDGFVPIAATTRRTSERLRGSGYLDHGLLHRLAVAPVSMPPLRARRTDTPALAECLLRRGERRHGVEVRPIAEDARRELAARDLPGNLIELDAHMTAALIRGGAGVPIDADLIRGLSTPSLSAAQAIQDNAIAAEVLRDLSSGPLSLNVLNSQLYRQAMQRCNGNVAAAARMHAGPLTSSACLPAQTDLAGDANVVQLFADVKFLAKLTLIASF